MFTNYLKIALRNFRRHKAYSFINISGLVIGLVSCILIMLYVQDEHSYDTYHENSSRIYRITTDELKDGKFRHLANAHAPLAPALLTDFPDIEQAVRFFPYQVMVEYGQTKRFQENHFFFTDSTVFDVFSFGLKEGQATTALNSPYSIVLSEDAAQKYFGDAEAIGKILTVENRFDFKVTGVLENVPSQSHFQFDFLATIGSLREIMGEWALASWYWPPVYTYLLLPSNYPISALENQFPEFLNKHVGEWASKERQLHLQPLTDIYLRSNLENEIAPTSSMAYVYIFSSVALFILLIACINFMNLATARSESRAREVGLRKVVGAQRKQLIKQFLGESLFYAFLALAAALTLIELFLPYFNALVEKQLTLNIFDNGRFFFGLFALTVTVGVLAGSYPAIFLSRFRPIQVLQGNLAPVKGGRSHLHLRALLVVLQFIISIVLIIAAGVIHAQLDYVRNKRLGFDKEHLLIIPIRDETVQNNWETVKSGILSNTNVLQASAISNFPWQQGYYDFPIQAEGLSEDTEWSMQTLIVDYDFVETFGMEIVDGRNFSRTFATDAKQAFILNEAAVKKLGWESPIGKKFKMQHLTEDGPKKGRVIGVVKDFHLRSLHHEVEPLVLQIYPAAYYLDNLVVKIKAENISETLTFLERKWHETVPYRLFEYRFLEDDLVRLYRKEEKLSQIFGHFSILAVFVGCLGLFGLASFAAGQRTKEIGIRKVLGATVGSVILLLSRDFAKFVLLAFILACPIGYWVMTRWLQNFAYRIDLGTGIFLFSGLLVLIIAILTVSFQAIKAGLTNPVDSLRYE